MHPPLCLFLLLTSVSWMMGAAARPVQERHILKDSKYWQELTDVKRRTLLTFLSALADWISQMEDASLMEEVVELANRQERSAFHQPRAWEKSPCRNFFWKTFSSC
ncbi:cortistatin [Malaclemys terrapin pileata]|uniref:cortistatin n=1 Tax=Malaclemys terrapin pileata TaxID=2991368 RepID=UPI0023A8C29F|nr:cortistatin [Malaclemys terrapin pileata]